MLQVIVSNHVLDGRYTDLLRAMERLIAALERSNCEPSMGSQTSRDGFRLAKPACTRRDQTPAWSLKPGAVSGRGRGPRRETLVGFALVLLVAWASAWAEVPRKVRLEYQREGKASVCPDRLSIQSGVAARLGYDPFRDDADERVRATLRTSGGVLEAHIELVDGHGNLKAQRRLFSPRRDCGELASSVELAVSIAIDPVASRKIGRPESAEKTETSGDEGKAGQPMPKAIPADKAEAQASPAAPLVGRVVIAAIGDPTSAPAPTLGLLVGGGVQGGDLSLSLEARADLPASKSLRTGSVGSSLLVGSLVPCLHAGSLAVCGLVTAGVLRGVGHGLLNAKRVTAPHLAFGARLGYLIRLVGRTALSLHGDVSFPLNTLALKVDEDEVWTSPAIAFAVGVGLLMRFP
jgi:hypothetical protein